MNKYLFTFCTLLASFSYAGPRVVGNGGVSVVCRNFQTQEITAAYTLDLFEAQNLNEEIPRSDLNVDLQVKQALTKLNKTPGVQYEISRQLRQLKAHTVFIHQPGVGLPLTDDALPRLRLKGCQYEQLAIYNSDTDTLTIDSEIYNSPKLSRTDAAALWLHEAVYKIDRLLNNAQNSVTTRDLVGQFFSASVANPIEDSFNSRFGRFTTDPSQKILWIDENQDYAFDLSVQGVPAETSCSIIAGMDPADTSWIMQPNKEIYENWIYVRSSSPQRIGPWINGAKIAPQIICRVPQEKYDLSDAKFKLVLKRGNNELMKISIDGLKRFSAFDFSGGNVQIDETSSDEYTVRLL